MTRTLIAALALLLVTGQAFAQADPGQGAPPADPPAAPPAFSTEKEKLSYLIGVSIARDLKRMSDLDLDLEVLVRGLREGVAGDKLAMTDDEMRSTATAYQAAAMKKQQDAMAAAAAANKKAGADFLAKNKTQKGVVTLPNGLQYQVIKAGTGKKPTAASTVSVNYRGTLIDGKEFDSSAKHGGPATFKVGGVIPGWTQALKMMPVGSKWKLFVPANLAYGDPGFPPNIAPGSTLVFEIELLSSK